MGKGDIKTKKGKIANGSFGVRRPKRVKKEETIAEVTTPAVVAEKPAKKAKAKA